MKDWPWYGYFLLALIIFGFFYLLYFKPKNQELQTLRDERINVEREVIKLRAKQKEIDKIEAELKSLSITLKDLKTIIPEEEEISNILRKIQQLAVDSRINITRFTPKGLINKEFYSEKPISVETTGNYHNLARFFDRLSNFSRLFNIENFSIKAVRDQTDASTISSKWTAKTYIFHEISSTPQERTKKTGK